jgi:hypothetical protein
MRIHILKKTILIILFSFYSTFSFGQDNSDINNPGTIPFSNIFYKFGTNTLNSVVYDYGKNYLIGGLGTYGMVKSGIDWEWSNVAANNKILTYSGLPFGILGFILPVALPMGMYIYGRSSEKTDYQITALALGQAAIQGLLISSTIKAFTGRREPDIFSSLLDRTRDKNDFSNDFAA